MIRYIPSTGGNGHLRPTREGSKKATERARVINSTRCSRGYRRKTTKRKPVGGEEQLVSVVKAAKLIGVKSSALRDLAYRGQIPGLIIGGALFFWMSHIERLTERMTKKTAGNHDGPTRSQS